ncbi:hypothetical protein ACIBEJ_34680 [Nonomuraea sp. NPDC050790]|uniref:hypothetical protein n=1 Tax=Nonomuraea sp. NPDC050790 TaxID=3364371 RepID=UPI003794C555
MAVVSVFCHACKAVHPHAAGGELIVCTGCGSERAVDSTLLMAAVTVAEMAFCPWCKETKPVGHDCPAGAVGCTERQPDETPCGVCARCQQVQLDDFQRRSELGRYGSPSDIDSPDSSEGHHS